MTSLSTSAYLLIDVAGKTCALPREAVREILPLPHLHEPPAIGGPLAGFVNLGGEPIPVVDLAGAMGLDDGHRSDPNRHLILSVDGTLALLVDRVVDLMRVPQDAVRPIDDAHTLNGCVSSQIAIADGFVHGLAIDRILTAEERSRVDAHARAAGLRLAAIDAAMAD